VTWQTELRAVIEVGRLLEGHPEWRTRALDFETSDRAIERWRTVGFVVGTLAHGETAQSVKIDPPKSKIQPQSAVPSEPLVRKPVIKQISPAPRSAPPAAAAAALDVGAATGPALEGLRSGVVVRSRWPVYDPLRALVSLRYLQTPTDGAGVRGRWLTLAVGGLVAKALDDIELAAAIDARAERFAAEASESTPLGEVSESSSRWLPGVAAQASVAWMPTARVGAFIAADAAWMLGAATIVEVREERVTRDSDFRITIEGGLRLRLW
jgi:hypothetical protein